MHLKDCNEMPRLEVCTPLLNLVITSLFWRPQLCSNPVFGGRSFLEILTCEIGRRNLEVSASSRRDRRDHDYHALDLINIDAGQG